MKLSKLAFITLSFLLIVLSACSNEDSVENETGNGDQTGPSNLIDINALIEGKWIDTKGNEYENSDMLMSQDIAYVSSKEYTISEPAYVSYFKEDEFLETVKYSFEETPTEIKEVSDADNIVISFFSKELDDITLTTE